MAKARGRSRGGRDAEDATGRAGVDSVAARRRGQDEASGSHGGAEDSGGEELEAAAGLEKLGEGISHGVELLVPAG